MGIVVDVLFDFESCTLLLHLHAEHDVEVLGLGQRLLVETCIFGVVSVLYEVAGVMPVAVAYAEADERLVHILLDEILTSEIDHRTCVASLVDDEERRYASVLCHLGIVGTKGGRDVHNTCTILRSDVVARDDTESVGFLLHDLAILERTWFHPGEELLVVETDEVRAETLAENFRSRGFRILGSGEINVLAALGDNVDGLLLGVGVISFDSNVLDLGTNAEGCV